jgi:hypothetical protein
VVSSPAILQFSINGIQLGTPFTAPAALYTWQQFSTTWNSSTNTTATICIVNQNTATSGNDFGIDDISFHECSCNVTVDAGPDGSVCPGESFTLSGSGNGTLTWSPATGLSCTSCTDPIANPTDTTTYYLSSIIGSCTVIDSVEVVVFPPVVPDAGTNTSICGGSTTQLTATGGSTYNWSPVTGLSDPFISNPLATPVASTTYFVTVTDVNACSGIDSVVITILPPVDFSISNDTAICAGHEAQLVAGGGVFYSWNPTTGLDDGYSASPLATPGFTTTYSVTVINVYGCEAEGSVTVAVHPDFTLTAEPDTLICQTQSVILFASGAAQYSWQPEDNLSCSDCITPTASPPVTTTYTLIGTDEFGCTKEATAEIAVNGACSVIMMPNAFTPNGDGLNDFFGPLGLGIDQIEFRVFNRWGNAVFYFGLISLMHGMALIKMSHFLLEPMCIGSLQI